MADTPTIARASDAELRALFNEAYLGPTLSGQLIMRPFGPQAPHKNKPDDLRKEPEGTITGLVAIVDPTTNQRVAVAHRLLRPDQTLGGSGKPDPKMVFRDGTVYLQKRKEGRQSDDLRTPSLFSDHDPSVA